MQELDIEEFVVSDIVLRRTLLVDRTSTSRLATDLGVHPTIIHAIFEDLRDKRYLDVHGLEGNDYRFSLTSEGRNQANLRYERCAYAGIAPVSLERYTSVVAMQKANVKVNTPLIKKAFADLVLEERMFEQIGPAFRAQQSAFFYGPTGTGKTSICERLTRLYTDAVAIPFAVEVDGQIITVFDPTMHRPLAQQPEGLDPRWIACHRPLVIVGGELVGSMLELTRDPSTGLYRAPLQMRANNGMLMIDDFGRQLMEPSALLNRWIVPLEKRVDYLTLGTGTKFPIPFEMMVVFSTNLDPKELVDDAFLRRIQNKVYVGAVNEEMFDEIFVRSARKMGVSISPEAATLVRTVVQKLSGTTLRACYPMDVCKLVKAVCEYDGKPVVLTRHTLWRAAELYFTLGQDGADTDFREAFLAPERQQRPTPTAAVPTHDPEAGRRDPVGSDAVFAF